MKSKLISDNGARRYALVFDKGDEVFAELLRFAQKEKITAAHFNALGALSDLTFGWFDPQRKEYKRFDIAEGVEVMSFVGNLATTEAGEPKLHAHVVIGKSDGTAHGGHFFEGHVWPTLEMVLVTASESIVRKIDEECGLPLIDLTLG
ncbi:MAG: PPC domain-containing DNA-binding protein [Pyrinomonadaceae bacterium]